MGLIALTSTGSAVSDETVLILIVNCSLTAHYICLQLWTIHSEFLTFYGYADALAALVQGYRKIMVCLILKINQNLGLGLGSLICPWS